MKKDELTQRLASQEAITPAAAADQLDEVIFTVLKKLKQGKPATFPGLGRIRPAKAPVAAASVKPKATPAKTKIASLPK